MMDDQKIIDNAPEGAIHVDGGLLYTDKNGICVSQSGYSSDIPSIRSLADIKELVELRNEKAELEKALQRQNKRVKLLEPLLESEPTRQRIRDLEQQAKALSNAHKVIVENKMFRSARDYIDFRAAELLEMSQALKAGN